MLVLASGRSSDEDGGAPRYKKQRCDDPLQECACIPACEPAWSDNPHGSHGFNCEVVWQRVMQGKAITSGQRQH